MATMLIKIGTRDDIYFSVQYLEILLLFFFSYHKNLGSAISDGVGMANMPYNISIGPSFRGLLNQ